RHASNRSASTPRACSRSSTTTGHTNSGPPSSVPSSAMPSAPAPSRTFWKHAAASVGRNRPSRWRCPTARACATSTSRPTAWRPTMNSLDPIPTTLSDQLGQLGLVHTATELNDLIARATQKRWSPVVLLEQLAQAELTARLHQRVERRLHDARLGRFKALADFEWKIGRASCRERV